MKNCIHLKNRQNKPYCKHHDRYISFNECSNCEFKEYKNYKPIKKVSKKRVFVSKKTYNEVFKRDNGTCQLCLSSDQLNLHHIIYRSESKLLINEIDNCIMLCRECHELVHSNKKKYQPILKHIIANKKTR